MRQLQIAFSELELAFESSQDMLSFYLDSENGEIISVSEDDQYYLNKITRSYYGRGAFRNFKNILLQYPSERQRWFQYKRALLHQHMLEWFDEQGIEPIPLNDAGTPG